MSLSKLKEEYKWVLEGKKPKCLGREQELTWKVPWQPGANYKLAISTTTYGQVKTEGSASLHGIHLDYNLPGGGKKTFTGQAELHIEVQE